ncbi:DUF6891 domain-containing protein [Streptomyces avicenniae]|uniref:DUF6891 domain-containing protein n=1 Tax=Streptomyces avicenniae TaxID=500153 RepID=UPI00069B89FB|nr:hypothetical protein [Streptomyces avicenniae]
MLEIVVETENAERHVRPTAGELAGLIRRIGGAGDRFLIVQLIPDLPDVFLQVWHEAGGAWTLEHRDGGHGRHFGTAPAGPEDVLAAMTGWARREDGWDAGHAWSPVDTGPAVEVPPLALDPSDRAALEEHLGEVLAAGYATRAELAETAEEYLVIEDHRPVSRAQAWALADRMWLARVGEQVAWRGETDPERLTRAFTALEAAGLTARESFTCCRSCGRSEIADAGRPDARGFVYFPSQAAESAAAGHGLALYYGGFDGSSATTTAVGREVVAALAAAGLCAEWSGDPDQAITVTPLDWRRRLIG